MFCMILHRVFFFILIAYHKNEKMTTDIWFFLFAYWAKEVWVSDFKNPDAKKDPPIFSHVVVNRVTCEVRRARIGWMGF